MLTRTALEHLTHRVVVRRRLPAPFGAASIYASTEGGLRYLRPSMARVDPPLLGLAAELLRPAQVVWDIGANVGLFSFAAAAATGPAGRVVAVEPDALLVGLLRRSASTNPAVARVDVLPVAVSDAIGIGQFKIAQRNRSTSYLDGYGTTQAGGTRETQLVPTVTLDWLAERLPRPDLIKIDVEGAETTVLRGGHEVLSRRPVVVCEVAGENTAAVAELLGRFGYHLYDGEQRAADRRSLACAPPCTLAIAGALRG